MQIDIVTPHRRLVTGERTEKVKLPGSKGQMEILENHAELLSTLTTGLLEFNGRRFAISQGFVEIKNEKVTVLAETCEESTEIDKARAQAAQKNAEEKLQGTLSDEDYEKYQLKLQRALIRQQLVN
ncbi:MAG: ATP synthase F1 subunit epsilon [Bdellovibrionaceae bacterium]|nr:ATP synthase F1 subunit epsilon [Pseudobdellovibrionaceae bacterium]